MITKDIGLRGGGGGREWYSDKWPMWCRCEDCGGFKQFSWK